MSRKLHISEELSLPLDVETSTLIVYGGKGMGKTNFGSVIAEECARAGIHFAIIDPMGVWWGLRHSPDGKGPGIEVLILGGIHGDIPIEPTGGAVVADLVVDEAANVIIDISRRPDGTMWPIADRVRFVRDYCKRLYQRQGEKRRPIFQGIDEAARFIPQVIRRDDSDVAACMGAIAVLVEEGRNVGIGVALFTQRSARLNKDVAELADCMVAFRTTGPNSRRAVLDWLGEHVEKEKVKVYDQHLRALPRGSALVVSPGWLAYEGVVAMRMRQTFDSSATPKRGKQRRVSGGAKPDLAKYRQLMAATIERAKAEDPNELKKRITELERQLRTTASAAPAQVLAGKDGVRAVELHRAQSNASQLQEHNQKLTQALEQLMKFILEINAQDFFTAGAEKIDPAAIQKAIDGAAQQLLKLVEQDLRGRRSAFEKWRRDGEQLLAKMSRLVQQDVKLSVAVKHNAPFSLTPAPRPPRPPRTPPVDGATAGLATAQRKILNALAFLEQVGYATPDKTQVSLFAGLSPTAGHTSNMYGGLRTAGLIEYLPNGRVRLTDAGDALADPGQVPQTAEEMQAYLLGRVATAQRKLLTVLIAAYPNAIDKREAAERAGLSPDAGHTSNMLGGLRSLGVIDYPEPGTVVALPVLFLEVA